MSDPTSQTTRSPSDGPRWIEHNWLLLSLAADGQNEAVRAIQDCWAEIDRLRAEVVSYEKMLRHFEDAWLETKAKMRAMKDD